MTPDLTDSLESATDPTALRRWVRYATAIGVANPYAWAEDALRVHLEPEHVAAQVAEGVRRLLDALSDSAPGTEREILLRELEACTRRILFGHTARRGRTTSSGTATSSR